MELKADSVEELVNGINPPKEKKKPKAVVTEETPASASTPEQIQESPATPEAAVAKVQAQAEEVKPQEETKKEAPKRRGRPRKKLEDMTPEEEIKLHTQRNTYSVQIADKETKKELYTSDNIFAEDGNPYVSTAEAKRHEEWIDLISSAQENNEIDALKGTKILKGRITGVHEIETPDEMDDDPNYAPRYMAKVLFKSGKWQIYIPSYVLYRYDYNNYNKATAEEVERNIFNRLGAEVSFVVRHANEKEGVVLADRLGALSMRAVRHYTIQGDRKRPDIYPGKLVKAKIVATSTKYITVDAAGAEIRIPLEEISWLYVSDAREFDGEKTEENYQIGETVIVKILSVDIEKVRIYNSSYTLVNATASIKQVTPNPKVTWFKTFSINELCSGKVTGFDDKSGNAYVNIDNHMDCKCKLGELHPAIGDTVKLRITQKDDEKLFLYGKLLR